MPTRLLNPVFYENCLKFSEKRNLEKFDGQNIMSAQKTRSIELASNSLNNTSISEAVEATHLRVCSYTAPDGGTTARYLAMTRQAVVESQSAHCVKFFAAPI